MSQAPGLSGTPTRKLLQGGNERLLRQLLRETDDAHDPPTTAISRGD